MSKNFLTIVLILAVLVVLALVVFRGPVPTTEVTAPGDSTVAISQAFSKVDIGDPEMAFAEVDSDIKSL